MIRIAVVDDHHLLREALCDLLRAQPGLEVVASVGSARSLVPTVVAARADVVLLDLEMPEHDPRHTVRELLNQAPDTHVVILSMHDDSALVSDLLSLGVRGYLHKTVDMVTLVAAIRGLRDPDRTTVVVSSPNWHRPPTTDSTLTPREVEVLRLVSEAMSNREIARSLDITEGTVKRHMRNIFEKLDAVSRIDAVNKAVETGALPSHRKKAEPRF
ncbi:MULTISPECIES: response regulator transcription factor [Nocardiopsidaceae]|uniref:Response regulator transcription factor n=1 Tax=Streptomonospora nanhaiensis TaxID=1323731 RepID=A0ABY6YPE8_9ACTN|nr:response regulator transcription factor [Streptomonospora nanhaiensis]WAE74103.1 response regulator transcription factor [Streptomonospora nanhaiensis]